MIDKVDNTDCCGCSSCAQRCPKQSISMREGEDGFCYPVLNRETCIECGLCLKVCQAISPFQASKPLNAYAAYNKDEEQRLKSSSGGMFILLAKYILGREGVVFGAAFNEKWEVVHIYSENIEGVLPMMGSKYVQSKIENTYKEAETFLRQGRQVLFTGTPCQIAGLYKYLQKEYENLLCMDFACHGVPGPGIWRKYLNGFVKEFGDINIPPSITGIEFRNKSLYSWENFGFVIKGKKEIKSDFDQLLLSSSYMNNLYMRGFLSDLYLRESCYKCKAKKFSTKSDFTVADFWGFRKLCFTEFGGGRGLSLLTVNTVKAASILPELDLLERKEISYEQAIISNPNLEKSQIKDEKMINKFNRLLQEKDFSIAIEKTLHNNFFAKRLLSLKYKLGIIK